MRVTYTKFPILTTSGTVAGVLDGDYEAVPRTGQQPGWYALHPVLPDGTVSKGSVASVVIVASETVA